MDDILRLSESNPMFYEYCPPFVTRESILNDMKALPQGKTDAEKYYIGLFMVDHDVQGHGIGSMMIEEYAEYIRTLGKKTIQLAFAKGNPQSEAFWQKNGFVRTGKEVQNDGYIAVCMKREL